MYHKSITIQMSNGKYRTSWVFDGHYEQATFDTLAKAMSNCKYFVRIYNYTLIVHYYPTDKM